MQDTKILEGVFANVAYHKLAELVEPRSLGAIGPRGVVNSGGDAEARPGWAATRMELARVTCEP